MKIEVGEQYDKLPKIRDIQAGTIRYWVLGILIILTVCLAGVPLVLYFLSNDFKNMINTLIFQRLQVNSKQITHYLICDSFSFKDGKRDVNYCTYITKPYYKLKRQLKDKSSSLIVDNQIVHFIQHKGLKYQINGYLAQQLKYKLVKTLEEYITNGISNKQLQQLRFIFGNSPSLAVPFYNIFFDIFRRRYLRYIAVLFAILKFVVDIFFFNDSIQENLKIDRLIIPIFILIIIIGNLVLSIFGSYWNKTSNDCLQQNQFTVIRQKQQLVVKFWQILVGDLIKLKQNDTIWFKGIYIAESGYKTYMIVNTVLNDHSDSPMIKVPLMHSLHEITQLNIVEYGSKIMGLGRQTTSIVQSNRSAHQLKINHYLIVTQIDCIQKFYSQYSSFKTYRNYQPFRWRYDYQTLVFGVIHLLFIASAFITMIILVKKQWNFQFILDFTLTAIFFLFPFQIEFFNFCSTLISIIRLKMNDAKVIRPIIQQLGLTQLISLNLNIFKKTQFNGFLKKQRSFGLQIPNKFKTCQQWIQMYKKTRSESTFAFFIYCGVMNINKIDQDPMARSLFKFFNFQFTNQEDFGCTKIKNQQFWKVCKINWRICQRFQLSNKFQQSVLIKDQFNDKYILIMEGYYVHNGCDEYFKNAVTEKRNQYLTTMKQFLQKGKIVRYLCFKKNISENQDLERNNLERNLTYAGLVVYDQWPTSQSLEVIQNISSASLQKTPNLETVFISNSQQSQIFGFDHQFQDRCFLFDQSSVQRTKFIRQKKMNKTILHCGKGIIDQPALLAADISIQFETQSLSQSDFLIKCVTNIQDILEEGRWTLQTVKLSIVFLTIINFCHLFGFGVEYFIQKQTNIQRHIFVYLFGMIVPTFLLNLYSSKQLNVLFQRNFLSFNLILNVFVSITCMFALYLIMWTDLAVNCEPVSTKKQFTHIRQYMSQTHMSQAHMSTSSTKQSTLCSPIINFISLSVGLLLIIILDKQSYARQANIFLRHINKVYMLIVWMVYIFNQNISAGIAIKSGITILILSVLVYLFHQLKDDNIRTIKKQSVQARVEQIQFNIEQTRL